MSQKIKNGLDILNFLGIVFIVTKNSEVNLELSKSLYNLNKCNIRSDFALINFKYYPKIQDFAGPYLIDHCSIHR